MSQLLQLPSELLMKIIGLLDWKTLLICRKVCLAFRDYISSSLECQYAIELAIAGLEDGPDSTMILAERLQRLREHQAAWRSLRWRTSRTIDMLRGGVWELYGGVLAQARGRGTLVFEQLPSAIRGITEDQWELVPKGLKSIRDFAMEPAYDLLVLVESATAEGTYRIHLRSLRTGKPHPKACNPAVLTHTPQGIEFSFAISISGEYLGVLFISSDDHESQILVWNWCTGVLEMPSYHKALKGQAIGSFGFLDDDRIMVGVVQHPEPALQIFNYKNASNNLTDIEDASFECSLQLPTLQAWVAPLAMSVRSDPSPRWQPSPDLKVPFFTSRNDRLFVVTLWVAEGGTIYTLLLFVPLSTIMSRLKSRGSFGGEYVWDEWGPHGSRMMKAPGGHSMIWVCYVFGQSFVSPWRTEDYTEVPVGAKAIRILDFNQLAVKKDVAEGPDHEPAVTEVVQNSSVLELGMILLHPVRTYLPYRTKTIRVPLHEDHAFNAVMLNEDTIVTVTSNPNVRQYRILSF
ncbi:hypothetical protein BDY19DRAFT_988597 [Irpex rosettiformis]|uniref:Uncharacterized protein n=1 Tax=Irpex rosettiformis TaxID=378272 RepID=A0ACB8UMB3_9APHY|nr:hypothetical protein BDY19DRAFT_988597 [Irpex rosettiformis]